MVHRYQAKFAKIVPEHLKVYHIWLIKFKQKKYVYCLVIVFVNIFNSLFRSEYLPFYLLFPEVVSLLFECMIFEIIQKYLKLQIYKILIYTATNKIFYLKPNMKHLEYIYNMNSENESKSFLFIDFQVFF